MAAPAPAKVVDTISWLASAHVPPVTDSAVERRIRQVLGAPSVAARVLAWSPWVAEATARLAFTHRSNLPPRLSRMISLVVSQDNSCRHCYGTQRALLRVEGLGEDVIRRLESDLHTAPLEEREQAALEHARRVSRAAPRVTPADLTALQAHGFTPAETVEITYLAATAVFTNRLATLLAIQPENIETMEGGPFGWLLRPLLRRFMGGRGVYPPNPVPAGTTTSIDALFAALEGIPGRDNLRRAVVDAQDSPLTTPRQKALVMAVTAAGLDCHLCARGARDLLRREGIAGPEADAIVVHLAGDRLTPFEVELMRFARETVRYRPEAIHRITTDYFKDKSPELIVELVGLCALANTLGRLSVLLPV